MTFKIEKGVPIPARKGPIEQEYPFAEMSPGDSFAVTVPEGRDIKWLRSKLTTRASSWAKRHAPGAQFTTRTEAEGKSARIWLLSKPKSLAPIAATPTPPPRSWARPQTRGRRTRPAQARTRSSRKGRDVRASDSRLQRRRCCARRQGQGTVLTHG